MANFMSAEVEIKVDDSKLVTQLAKARSAVTKTVDRIKSSFRKMGASFKAVFDKMVKYAKWGALAMVGAFALVTRAAMKQQDAVFLLISALKISGEYTKALEVRFRAFASSVQQATIYGDEEVLALMQLQKSLGVTADKLEEAAKMSIGLATATGRDVKSMAMYIALALQGEFTMLRRYIPALRTTTDKTEQLRIITEFAAAGFKLAEERAKTASGGLKQMWNALGDIAEVIGAALLPGIQSVSKAIKEWAERNQDRIGRFAETTAAYMAYVKDVLWAFVKFLQSDWKTGIKAGLDISLELFKGFGKSLIIIMQGVGRKAADSFLRTFGKELGAKLMEMSEKLSRFGAPVTKQILGRTGAGIFEAAVKVPKTPEGSATSERLKQVWQETAASIKALVPPELEEAFDKPLNKLKDNLKEIGAVVEDIKKPMEDAFVKTPKKASEVFTKMQEKLSEWASNAKNIWSNLADVAVKALDGTADALTNLVVKGKADFNALAESILMDMTRVIIKAQMAQTFGAMAGMGGIFGSIGKLFGGIPGLQFGGEVKKTGLAVVHKGETYSGVQGGQRQQGGNTININVNAIDAAGTFQFLKQNKRAIATMMQGEIKSNHPFRSSIKKG